MFPYRNYNSPDLRFKHKFSHERVIFSIFSFYFCDTKATFEPNTNSINEFKWKKNANGSYRLTTMYYDSARFYSYDFFHIHTKNNTFSPTLFTDRTVKKSLHSNDRCRHWQVTNNSLLTIIWIVIGHEWISSIDLHSNYIFIYSWRYLNIFDYYYRSYFQGGDYICKMTAIRNVRDVHNCVHGIKNTLTYCWIYYVIIIIHKNLFYLNLSFMWYSLILRIMKFNSIDSNFDAWNTKK